MGVVPAANCAEAVPPKYLMEIMEMEKRNGKVRLRCSLTQQQF